VAERIPFIPAGESSKMPVIDQIEPGDPGEDGAGKCSPFALQVMQGMGMRLPVAGRACGQWSGANWNTFHHNGMCHD